jgi:hypothetical protein
VVLTVPRIAPIIARNKKRGGATVAPPLFLFPAEMPTSGSPTFPRIHAQIGTPIVARIEARTAAHIDELIAIGQGQLTT